MRLINTATLELRDFMGRDLPDYAILSHTWQDEEVSFAQYQDLAKRQELRGWAKIKGCCQVAAFRHHKWLWVDTCCINKDSSAELTEAINSMYRWYEYAAVCIVYLCDVNGGPSDLRSSSEQLEKTMLGQLSRSRWFTRGWTLQELLAADSVQFFDQNWHWLGSKDGLVKTIVAATGINALALTYNKPVRDFSVAARMSWAAARQCTRMEDEAYCLMGLFDVNMPLLYGEGRKAFDRLQGEILKTSDDETIFAWTPNGGPVEWATYLPQDTHGLLARSARDFRDSGDFVPHELVARPLYQLTNRGMQIHVPQ